MRKFSSSLRVWFLKTRLIFRNHAQSLGYTLGNADNTKPSLRDAAATFTRVPLPSVLCSRDAQAEYMGRCARSVATYPPRSDVNRIKRSEMAGTPVSFA